MSKVIPVLAGLCVLAAGGAAGIYALAKKRAESLDCHLGNAKDFKKYQSLMSEDTDENVIFGTFQGNPFGLSLDSVKTNRSTNVLTIGGSDSERKDYIKYNIMQENSSALIVDKDRTLFLNLAPKLKASGYPVYLFDLSNLHPCFSNFYNPLDYVYDEKGYVSDTDIYILTDILINPKNTGFWRKAEKAFLTALIYYVLGNDEISREDKCFATILEKVKLAATLTENDYFTENDIFSEMESWMRKASQSDNEFSKRAAEQAKLNYDTFQLASKGKLIQNIVVITEVDLMIFSEPVVSNITRTETKHPDLNIDFKKLCSQQAYLFVMVPDGDAYKRLLSLLFCQFYATAYKCGEKLLRGKYHVGHRKGLPTLECFDSEREAMEHCKANNVYWSGDEYAGKDPALPVHVNIFLDDFANLGELKNFTTVLATCRKYRIGNHCIINSLEELEKVYPDGEHECLIANVDTILYFGGENVKESDAEFIKSYLEEVDLYYKWKKVKKRYREGCEINFTPTIHSPMSTEEIFAIGKDNTDEIVMVRNWYPFVCQKCKPENHKRYKEYHDASK